MELKIPRGIRTIAFNCLQFGDTGKGKLVDLFSSWADIIIRGTGGANAGHSIEVGGLSLALHLIPCGILQDGLGKVNVGGSGMAIDPRIFCEELEMLRAHKLTFNNLMLALNAKLTLPTQIVRDRVGEADAGKGKIGTTGRGIGPTYSDHALRVGLFVNDLLNPDILVAGVKANVEFSTRILRSYDPAIVKEVMHQQYLGNGVFWHPEKMFDVDAIVQKYLEYGRILDPLIRDTDKYVQQKVGREKLLCEGAQGSLLDVDVGTRPKITSSNCTVDGLAKGAGLNRSHIDIAYGIFKGFYMTRVGAGPFPTECGGMMSEDWCNDSKTTRAKEEELYPDVSVNDKNEFLQGIALRRVGKEYGATTKRPRRTGWFDLPLLREALRWGSPDVVLTKLDVLNDCDEIKVCVQHRYDGPAYRFGDKLFQAGDRLDVAIPAAEFLKYCRPVYQVFPGWKKSLKGITKAEDLPEELSTILDFAIAQTGIRPGIVSVGADREETIFV